jgi:hypothetical protein
MAVHVSFAVAVGKGLFFPYFFICKTFADCLGWQSINFSFFCFALQPALPTSQSLYRQPPPGAVGKARIFAARFLALQGSRQSWEMCFFAVFAALPHVSQQPKHIYV